MDPIASDHSIRLKVGRLVAPVLNLGPGRRIGMWVQGCSLACHGCVSPSLWNRTGGSALDIRQLAALMADLADKHQCQGITISGGEPFEQYEALMALCALIRKISTLDIFVYSGFRLREIEEKHPDRFFLSVIDYLVDGRYIEHDNVGEPWRGSRNQQVLRFTAGKPHNIDLPTETAPWTVSVPSPGRAYTTGIPKSNELNQLADWLSQAGISTQFR